MTFGLRNAGNTFQRLMDRILGGLPFVFVYLDDVLIGSVDETQHAAHLRAVLSILQQAGLVLNGEKCVIGVQQLDFLGHRVTAGGFTPLLSAVDAIMDFPLPSTVKQLQGFLGVINFYRKFVPAAARLLRPLTESLKGSPRPTAVVEWSQPMLQAVEDAKRALSKATLLAHPAAGAELGIAVDASAEHVGAALQQRASPAAAWQPLGFFSKKLEPAQVKYSAFDRELLACYLGIRHFRFMLEGRAFTVYTDHKPLTQALARTSEPWTARQSRQLSYVAEFTADIRHVPGVDNIVADTLSRPPAVNAVAASSPPPDWAAIAAHQATCGSTQKASSSGSLQVVTTTVAGVPLLCDVSQGVPRPLIPEQDRRAVFNAFHGLAHPGTRATRRILAARVVWRGMASDVATWVRDCQPCCRGKVTTQPTVAPAAFPVPHRRFQHVHVDLVGPLPPSPEGFQYLLTMVDRTTRWLEATPLRSMDAETCVQAFTATWVARFGVPAVITTDQGTQFTSSAWQSACSTWGSQHITTTAFHPQSNGMVERSHRQLKDALRARLAGTQWYHHLPWVLLGLRAAPKDVGGTSSAELVFGCPPSLPGEFLTAGEKAPHIFTQHLQQRPPVQPRRLTYAQAACKPPAALLAAPFVYVRRGGSLPPLTPPYAGPYRVLESGPKTFLIDIGGKSETISVDRLKPHQGTATLQPAAPPRRGRPPRQ
jgi:hypothetical protein